MATTTNMGLVLPEVSVTIGPTYATQNNTAFTTVDSHDHTSGKGVLIPTAGININADLEFNSSAALELQKVGFDNLGALLTGNNFAQVSGGELYFNDGSGNQVQITSGGSLDITSSGGIGGDYTSAGASLIYTDSTRTYTFRDGVPAEAIVQFEGAINNGKYEWSVSSPAGNVTITDTDTNFVILVDTTAARTITLPDPTLGERVVKIKDRTGTADEFNITVARNGSETIDGTAASKTINTPFGCLTLASDSTNWFIIDEYRGEDRIGHALEALGNSNGQINFGTDEDITLQQVDDTFGTYITGDASTEVFNFTKEGLYSITVKQLVQAAANGFYTCRLLDSGDSLIESITVNHLGTQAADENHTFTFAVDITDTTEDYNLNISNGGLNVANSFHQASIFITYLGDNS